MTKLEIFRQIIKIFFKNAFRFRLLKNIWCIYLEHCNRIIAFKYIDNTMISWFYTDQTSSEHTVSRTSFFTTGIIPFPISCFNIYPIPIDLTLVTYWVVLIDKLGADVNFYNFSVVRSTSSVSFWLMIFVSLSCDIQMHLI